MIRRLCLDAHLFICHALFNSNPQGVRQKKAYPSHVSEFMPHINWQYGHSINIRVTKWILPSWWKYAFQVLPKTRLREKILIICNYTAWTDQKPFRTSWLSEGFLYYFCMLFLPHFTYLSYIYGLCLCSALL